MTTPTNQSGDKNKGQRRPITLCGCLLAALALLISGCGAAASSSDKVLRLAATASGPFTKQFNPLLTSSAQASGYVTLSIYQELMIPNYASGKTQPWLATSYKWSTAGKALTIQIRKNTKWSNGKPLTAEDVAFTFDLLAKNAALNAQSLPLVGAEATSPTTVVVHFSEPAFQTVWWRTSIVPKAIWSKVSDPVKFTNPNPVGSGPFVLDSYSPNVINLKPNTYYSNPPKVQGLRYISYDSDTSAVSALQADEVDWISPAISDPKSIAAQQPNKLGYWVTPRSTGIVFLVPNLAIKPLNDLALRQAINASLDRQQISTVGLGGLNAPINSPVGLDTDSQAEEQLIAPKYRGTHYGAADPRAAKRILTAAGYTLDSHGFFNTPQGRPLNIVLKVPTSSAGFGDMIGAGQVIARQLAAAGIKVTLASESPTAWRADLNVGNFQLSLRAIGGTLSTYSRYQRMLDQDGLVPVGKNALANYERFTSPQAGTFLKDYASAPPGSPQEKKALAGLETIVATQFPVIPLYMNAGIGMWRKDRFTGWPSGSNPYATSVAAEPSVAIIGTTVAPVG